MKLLYEENKDLRDQLAALEALSTTSAELRTDIEATKEELRGFREMFGIVEGEGNVEKQ